MKANKWFLCGVVNMCIAFAAFLPQRVSAAGPYLKLDGGANFLQDVTVTFAGFSESGRFDTGYRVDLVGGYELNRFAAIELETGYLENSMEHSHHSWMGQAPLLANFVLRLENESPFIPYVGIGAGGVLSVLHADIFTGDTLLIAEDATAATFAYQAMAGVAFRPNPHVEFNVGYKFLGTTEQRYEVLFSDSDLKIEDVQNHFVGASITVKF